MTEVASALALITALAIDPSAVTTPVVAAPGPEAARGSASDALRLGLRALSPSLPDPGRTGYGPASRFRFATGVGASLASGVAPSPLFGGLVFAEITREAGTLSQAVRLGVERSLSGQIGFATGAAALSRTIGVIEVRPWSFAVGSWVFAPSLGIEAGALHGDGSGILLPGHPTRPWVAADLGGGATWRFYGPLFLDITATLGVPFVRDSFYFDPHPETTLFRPSAAGFRGVAGLGVRFP